ncbi:reprolysin-like metallopeptidase [Flavobacterium sp.]|uniref:zinc-dependent metalloprotease n=1 Tax=Flavobacterium sp. TaxID=239 RepID=UPI003D26D0BE
MKKTLLLSVFSFLVFNLGFSQTEKAWSKVTSRDIKKNINVERETFPQEFKLMQLNVSILKQTLSSASDRFSRNAKGVIISLPNAEGVLERFEVFEASNFDADLQAQFPEIRSYAGNGIDDKFARVRLSIDPKGIQTMVHRAGKGTEFMEPYSEDGSIYSVYRSSRVKGKLPFTCSTPEQDLVQDLTDKGQISRSSSGELLTFRLALSCTGEYANYFGATSAAQVGLVNAAFNATMTRVNGIFETDFGIHMNIVASNNNVIFYNPATDPYSPSANMANWNTELQQTLNTTLTGPATPRATNNAAYDVGHLFGADGGGGNAGCIGCVCVDGLASGNGSTKGRGITSPADAVPMGDFFDVDYVAHELGHQFGANHTFSHASEGTGVNKEVGGGVTVMGYAGITGFNTHMNSIDVFHSASIAQVQANMVGKTCPTRTTIQTAPVVNAGANYTIPISTPFMLTGSASGSGSLTYTWEQNNDAGGNTGANSPASATKTIGPNFVCFPDSPSPTRYFPRLSSVMNGSTTTEGVGVTMEALSSVARTLNFRLTARDNVAGQGQTNFADMVITVDASRGPLTVTSQNTGGISYDPSSVQTVTWVVNNTNTSAGGTNVDILITTDNGATWSTLLAGTPNDGTQTVTMPATPAPYCRLMVKASGNVFFNVNSTDFAVGYTITTSCNTYTNNTSLPVPDGTGANTPGATVTKTINVPVVAGDISDVNVTLGFTHTYIEDLVIEMDHPDATRVALWNRNCDNAPGSLEYIFSDGNTAVPTTGCTATSGTWGAPGLLSSYNGKTQDGVWTLRATDWFTGDTGNIQNWSIEICTQQAVLATENFGIEGFSLYPNPNNGTFNIQFTSTSSNEVKVNVHDMRGREIYNKSFQNNGLFNESLQLNNVQSGVYLVTVQDGARKEVKKIVVE